jgi:hypothetical protein
MTKLQSKVEGNCPNEEIVINNLRAGVSVASNISFQILSLGNSSEQLHHWIPQVLDLQDLNLCFNCIATTIAIQIVLASQIHIQTNQENSWINEEYGLNEASFAEMLVQDGTLSLVLEGHALDKGEAKQVHDTVGYELLR